MTALPGRVRPVRARQLSISREMPGSSCAAAPAPRSWCPAVSTVQRNQFGSRPSIIGLSGGPERGDAMKTLAMRSAAKASAALCFPAHSIAGRVGTSLKHEHLPAILADGKRDRFFEVHAENYMGAGGPPHAALSQIRQDYAVSLHGVCMSIGGPQPLDKAHLRRFKALVDRY